VEPFQFVECQQAAGGELGQPGHRDGCGLGQVGKHQPRESQIGACHRPGGVSDIVSEERQSVGGILAGSSEEILRVVQAHYSYRSGNPGQQSGGMAGPAAKVDSQCGRAAHLVGQENVRGRVEEVR
jgi:hypothetical protein